jgi:hypothetical protein
MTLARAINIVLYGGSQPADISPGRWRAIVKYVQFHHGS